MKYVFVDTDNGTSTPGTPVQTSSSWPAVGDRFRQLSQAWANATVLAETDDITVYCKGATVDTGLSTISTAQNAASIRIVGDVATAAWSAGVYTNSHNAGSATTINVSYERNFSVENIQANYEGTSTAFTIRIQPAAGTGIFTIKNCHLRVAGSSAGAGATIRYQNAIAFTLKVENCTLSPGASPGGIRDGFSAGSTTATVSVYNSIAQGFATGITATDTTVNCVSFNNTDDFGVSAGGIDYCASDDGDGTHAVTGLAWGSQFVDYANGDYRLNPGSGLIATGIGPTADANVPVTDITGRVRTGTTTAIGVALFAALSPTPYVTPFAQRNIRHAGRFLR